MADEAGGTVFLKPNSPREQRKKIWLLLVISILFVLLGQAVMIMGVVFSLLLLDGRRLKFSTQSRVTVRTFFTVYAFSMLFELSAIATGYAKNEFGGGTLFHPEPQMDILISQCYWIPFSLFWTYLFTRYSFSRKSVFWTAGVYGMLTEQLFLVPMLLLSLNPFVLIAAPYVLMLYGSAITAPYLIVENILPKDKPTSKWQYILPSLVLFPLLFAVFAIFHTVTGGVYNV